MKLIRIHPADNVAVALEDVKRGETIPLDGGEAVTTAKDVARGHKLALRGIEKDEAIVKYGNPIGFATRSIPVGAWVHVHNVRTGLSESADYVYEHKTFPLPAAAPRTFEGYRRADGRAAVRNELWIIPTVGCVNSVAQTLARHPNAGGALLRELADYAGTFRREPIPAGELVVGVKCGGSDGLSGITANPAVGRFSDRLVALGGSTVLTVAGGKRTKAEERGAREISILKDGVVL